MTPTTIILICVAVVCAFVLGSMIKRNKLEELVGQAYTKGFADGSAKTITKMIEDDFITQDAFIEYTNDQMKKAPIGFNLKGQRK